MREMLGTFQVLKISDIFQYSFVLQCTFQVILKINYLTAVTLSGMGGEEFRGLLVQGRQVAGGSPVGRFINFAPNTQASQCTPPTVLTYIPVGHSLSYTPFTPSYFEN